MARTVEPIEVMASTPANSASSTGRRPETALITETAPRTSRRRHTHGGAAVQVATAAKSRADIDDFPPVIRVVAHHAIGGPRHELEEEMSCSHLR